MHITKVELENIKSHTQATFEFERGTTAITGENGAGKTTIIEAIAWTLFDLLDYKKDDFASRGSKKGVARVTFESGLDERLYTVYRDTANGYYVYDPALKTRIADKKEEVCRFLWQHLGVEPGTDLDALFRRAIGVPQGTFTAIFLETASERKKAFDRLLKVEEYRRGADELLRTARFVEQQIADVNVRIARAEGELARFETLDAEYRTCCGDADELTVELETVAKELSEKNEVVRSFAEKEGAVARHRGELDALKAELSRAELVVRHAEAALGQAVAAADRLEKVREDAEHHLRSLGRLSELERERSEREKLLYEYTESEKAIAAVKAEQKTILERLENARRAHQEIEELQKKASEQDRLEAELVPLREQLAEARSAAQVEASLEEQLQRLRKSYTENQRHLTEAEGKAAAAADLAELERRNVELVQQLAKLKAELERDERFQAEIQDGLCPILSAKCLNLKEGETLEAFISSQFTEVHSEIVSIETESLQVTVALNNSRQGEKAAAQAAAYRRRAEEIAEEGKSLNTRLADAKKKSQELGRLETAVTSAEAELGRLNNPKARITFLEDEAKRTYEYSEKASEVEANLERLTSDLRITAEKLESYKDLDSLWAQATAERNRTAEAHREYLINEPLAQQLEIRRSEYEASKRSFEEIEEKRRTAEKALEDAASGYDEKLHSEAKDKLSELERRNTETGTRLAEIKKRQTALASELDRLKEMRQSLSAEFREKEKHQQVAEVTTFVRDTLKEAAPLVARNYVYRVSQEANQMFREISGNAELTLKWGEDYGIFLEENGRDRPFVNLSGGEQMAAALSVRLALLKQLTDIRIAFFDEPTTNMDAERRENLAQQIGRIGHFDQLFVISHDDTFEGYMDHELRVAKAA